MVEIFKNPIYTKPGNLLYLLIFNEKHFMSRICHISYLSTYEVHVFKRASQFIFVYNLTLLNNSRFCTFHQKNSARNITLHQYLLKKTDMTLLQSVMSKICMIDAF